MHVETADGWRLELSRFAPAGSGQGAVLLTHAMMASARTLRSLAVGLSARGLDVFTLDFRGHGASAPPRARDADWCFDDYVRFDLPAAIQAVRSTAGCSAVAYIGHSLGGLVGLAAGAPFSRQVLLATCVWRFAGKVPWQRKAVMASYRTLVRTFGYAPIRRLRLGSDDEPKSYVEQIADCAFRGQWRSRDGHTDYAAQLATIRTPTLSLVAGRDALCSPRDAHGVFDSLGAREKELRVVEHVRGHFGLLRDGFVWEDVARWIVSAPSTSAG
jgi:predicted alpha/beta hydrolase